MNTFGIFVMIVGSLLLGRAIYLKCTSYRPTGEQQATTGIPEHDDYNAGAPISRQPPGNPFSF